MTFVAVVTCTIATDDGGLVSMVVQDHRNESLTPDEPSPTARLQKGTATVTLTHSAVVPAEGSAVKVFLPLFVDGSNTTRAMKIVDYTVG